MSILQGGHILIVLLASINGVKLIIPGLFGAGKPVGLRVILNLAYLLCQIDQPVTCSDLI